MRGKSVTKINKNGSPIKDHTEPRSSKRSPYSLQDSAIGESDHLGLSIDNLSKPSLKEIAKQKAEQKKALLNSEADQVSVP